MTAIRRTLESLFLFVRERGHFHEAKRFFQQAQVQLAADSNDIAPLLWAQVLTRGAWLWGLHGSFREQYAGH